MRFQEIRQMIVLKRYVSRSVTAATAIVLFAFIGLDIIFRIIEESNNIAENYTFLKVLAYEFLRTPARLYEVMPIVGLIGCLTGLGALANSSELIVMRTAGVSTFSLVWISLRSALIFLLVAMLIGEYVAPKSEQLAASYRDFARHKSVNLDLKQGLWLRDDNDFVFVNVVQPSGVMFGINIFKFGEQQSLNSIVRAERATYNQSYWLMEGVEITVFENDNGLPQQISKSWQNLYRWQSSINPDLLGVAVVNPDNLKISALWSYVHYLKAQGLNSKEYELALWDKIFYPLVMISLVLAGISFIFGPLRQVTMGYRVFWGILLGVLFKTLQNTLGPISIVFGFSPILAMLTPALLCAVVGVVLLLRVR